MGEHFQGRERLFVFEIKYALMGLDTVEVEGYHAIEQSLSGRKVLGMLRLIGQALSDRRGRFRHARSLSGLQ